MPFWRPTKRWKPARLEKWLIDRGLLLPEEGPSFARLRNFPETFPERVLGSCSPATPSQSAVVATETVISGEPFPFLKPPRMLAGGSIPTPLRHAAAQSLPAEMHHMRGGKIFTGHAQTTLMLEAESYFEPVSSPASPWLTPALWSAPADLSLNGTVAVLFADGASLFSHWMFDLLPKIAVLNRAGWTPERVDYYLVNTFHEPFQRETMAAFGIPDSKVIPTGGKLVEAKQLLVPSKIRSDFRTPHWAREFVVRTLLGDGGDVPEKNGAKLYISRAKAKRRRILNEDEVRDFVERRGFSTILAEGMTVRRLAEMVSRAEQIVAPHGAGAVNVAFARPGVRLMELFGSHLAAECWLMTNDAGGHYFALPGRNLDGSSAWDTEIMDRAARNAADYAIDLAELGESLDILGSFPPTLDATW